MGVGWWLDDLLTCSRHASECGGLHRDRRSAADFLLTGLTASAGSPL